MSLVKITINPAEFLAYMRSIGWPEPDLSADWLTRINCATEEPASKVNVNKWDARMSEMMKDAPP